MNNVLRDYGPLGIVLVVAIMIGIAFWDMIPNGTPAKPETLRPSAQAAPLARTGPAAKPGTLAHTVTQFAMPAGAAVSIVRDPIDLLAPLNNRAPSRVKIELETIELPGKLADGATFT